MAIVFDQDELFDLLGKLCDGTISAATHERLQQILSNEPTARQMYFDYLDLHIDLRRWPWNIAPIEMLNDAARQKNDGEPIEPRVSMASQPQPICIVAPPIDVAGSFLGASGYYSSSWPMAYLVAAVVVGIGLTIAGFVHVSSPERQVAIHSASLPTAPRSSIIAQVTGMECVLDDAECKIASGGLRKFSPDIDHSSSNIHYSAVSLGDRFAIRSGVLEITYDTGAKVVLQGPATYEVESAVGGYLSVGKLTARLEKKKEPGIRNEEPSDPRSLFSVRTPTAVVTDLGTEFGVSVEKDNSLEVHVFRGLVDVRRCDLTEKENRSAPKIRLSASQGIRIDRGSAQVRRVQVDGSDFPAIRRSASQGLVARYAFDKINEGLVLWTPDSQNGQHRGLLSQEMTQANLTSGKIGNALGFNVAPNETRQSVMIHWSPAFDFVDQSFTIAMWLNRRAAGTEKHEIILAKENFSPGLCGGYAILRDRASGKLIFRVKGNGDPDWNAWISTHSPEGQDDAPEGQWVHFAVVGRRNPDSGLYDIQLYRNGERAGCQEKVLWSVAQLPLRLGAQEDGWAFRGLLDDIQLYNRALRDEEVEFLFSHPGALPTDTAGVKKR